MIPVSILCTKSGLVHRAAPDARPSRNRQLLLRPACPSRAMLAWGVDAPVNCQHCLGVRWGADALSGGARRARPSKTDLSERKLGRLLHPAMAYEYTDLIDALGRRLLVGDLYHDVVGTSLDLRVPTKALRHFGAKVWHPWHVRRGTRWLVQTGNVWTGDVDEHVYDEEDIAGVVLVVESYFNSHKQ